MSEIFFPINDLLRRKFQTSLVIISLMLSTGSTLFLLLFGSKLGGQISLMAQESLTIGFTRVFSPLLTFLGFLAFLTGAVIVSFLVYVMMAQRVKDIGLMKAAGCPNNLVFGYFFTELLMIVFVSCILGAVFGVVADYSVTILFSSFGFGVLQKPVNFGLVLVVLGAFFGLALVFGVKPILDVVKVEPVKAMSPLYRFGVGVEGGFKVVSRSGFTSKIALRSLFRRKSGTIRIVLCLSVVFVLLTVAVAGAVIAEETTKGWVTGAIGEDLVLVAHHEMMDRYGYLLSKFHGASNGAQSGFNYTRREYLVSQEVVEWLGSMSQVTGVERRLVFEEWVEEIQGFLIDEETASLTFVGDRRNGTSLIVGVEPGNVLNSWGLEGRFLREDELWEAVVGDSQSTIFSMPLVQSISVGGIIFNVTGVCVDPINNGNVTFVPLEALEKRGFSGSNVVILRVDPNIDRETVLEQIRGEVKVFDPALEVYDLNLALERNMSFLGFVWSIVLFLPLFSVASAGLCLVSYVVLAIDEQRREFGVLRAVGVKPKTVVKIISEQSFVVLISSFGIAIPIGVIVTLLILISEPAVTGYTILQIAGWLSISLLTLFVASLVPALRFAWKPILDVMSEV